MEVWIALTRCPAPSPLDALASGFQTAGTKSWQEGDPSFIIGFTAPLNVEIKAGRTRAECK